MATRTTKAPPPPALATEDEAAILTRAANALSRATNVSTYGDMAHVEGEVQHALILLATMRQRHLEAANAQLAQLIRLRVQWFSDFTHRLIVWDERYMERVPPDDQPAVHDDIEQRREFVRQAQGLLEAIQ